MGTVKKCEKTIYLTSDHLSWSEDNLLRAKNKGSKAWKKYSVLEVDPENRFRVRFEWTAKAVQELTKDLKDKEAWVNGKELAKLKGKKAARFIRKTRKIEVLTKVLAAIKDLTRENVVVDSRLRPLQNYPERQIFAASCHVNRNCSVVFV